MLAHAGPTIFFPNIALKCATNSAANISSGCNEQRHIIPASPCSAQLQPHAALHELADGHNSASVVHVCTRHLQPPFGRLQCRATRGAYLSAWFGRDLLVVFTDVTCHYRQAGRKFSGCLAHWLPRPTRHSRLEPFCRNCSLHAAAWPMLHP